MSHEFHRLAKKLSPESFSQIARILLSHGWDFFVPCWECIWPGLFLDQGTAEESENETG